MGTYKVLLQDGVTWVPMSVASVGEGIKYWEQPDMPPGIVPGSVWYDTDDPTGDYNPANYLPYVVPKEDVQSVTNSTALVDDTQLKCTLSPGTWRVHLDIRVNGPQAGDFKKAWTFSGSLNSLSRHTSSPAIGTTTAQDTNMNVITLGFGSAAAGVGTDGVNGAVATEDLLLRVTTGGVLQFQWAQIVANATATTLTRECNLYYQRLVESGFGSATRPI